MIVVDASVAAKWLFPDEQHADRALALLAAALRSGTPVLAPPLLASELTNTIRERMRREGVPIATALTSLDEFLTLPLTFASPDRLHNRALILAAEQDLAAAHDAHYVALAETLGCELWTDDRRLIRNLATRFPFVRAIGDYAATEEE